MRRLLDRIRDLAGEEAANELTPVDAPRAVPPGGLKITGFIGKAGVSRATRASQRVFINGRVVENAVVNAALREGYHTALMKGRYPVTCLFLDMDPAAVDVNVHPSKREVRFRDPGTVREALTAAVRRTLEAGRAPSPPPRQAEPLDSLFPMVAAPPRTVPPLTDFPLPEALAALPRGPSAATGQFNLLGVRGRLYVLI